MISHNQAELLVEVKDMKPRHVYMAQYGARDGNVGVSVQDLGERPKYGLTLGKSGLNQTYFPASFDK
jgi:hypothetical protein